jgi:hypothetical protein
MKRSFEYEIDEQKITIKFDKENIYIYIVSEVLGQITWVMKGYEKTSKLILELPPDLIDSFVEMMAVTIIKTMMLVAGTMKAPELFSTFSTLITQMAKTLRDEIDNTRVLNPKNMPKA